ncbi:MAG: hypothetical protein ACI8PB_001250 [Desulforhopalus sp.]|jgi:hypothetical protein
MKNQTMLSKTIGMQKAVFTNSLAIFSTMQQHGEDLLKTTLEQSPWLLGSSKDACFYWADFSSKYLENLKSVADQGFAAIEQVSSPSTKPEENEPQQTKKTARVPAPRPAKKSPAARKKTVGVKKTVDAKMLPGTKAVAQNVSADNPVAREKNEVKKPEEVKAATSMPKPSVISEPIAPPVLEGRESVKKILQKKG